MRAFLGLALLLLAGCSAESRQRWLPFFFDGVPDAGRPPPPPTRRVRQDLQRELEALRVENADLRAALQARSEAGRSAQGVTAAEQARTWAEAEALLPRDAGGAVDWGAAVAGGLVQPRPGRDPEAPTQAVFDLDVPRVGSGHPFFTAGFRHAPHTRWLACGSCHPAPFPLAAGHARPAVTMAAIRAGKACGMCHGPVAFGVETRCEACHPGIPATDTWRPPAPATPLEGLRSWKEVEARLPVKGDAPDWTSAQAAGLLAPRSRPGQPELEVLDLDVERVPKAEGEDAKAIFPHNAHTVLLACDTCHPAPFAMEAGGTPMSMDAFEKGELCGLCHGKTAFPLSACGRCHPAMGG